MQVKTITYRRLVNLGNYENESYEVEIALQEGDDPNVVAAQAKMLTEQFLGCAPDTYTEPSEQTFAEEDTEEDPEDDDSPF